MSVRTRPRRPPAAGYLRSLFAVTPWWTAPLVALVAALAIRYGTERVFHWSPFAATEFALGAALLILLTGVRGLMDRGRRQGRLRRTRSPETLQALSWTDFEALVADAYRYYGWDVTEVGALSKGGPDGGVDLVLRRGGEVVAVQCKCWRERVVGVRPVRELKGALADCGAQRGIVAATGRFTADAVAYAERNGVQLLDGTALLASLPGATPVPPDALAPPQPPEPMSCPHCHGRMVMKKSRYGLFWGCARYPHCRGKRQLS